MFNITFDDYKRKLLNLDKKIFLKELTTAMANTPEFDTYMRLYLAPNNDAIHITWNHEQSMCTFYTIVTDPKIIAWELERKAKKYEQSRSDPSAAFV